MTEDTETTTDEAEQYDEHHRHDRVSVGATAEVSLTRGTGTRDQEKFSLKGKGVTADAAMDELRTQLEDVVGPLDDDEPLADQIRAYQPGEDDD